MKETVYKCVFHLWVTGVTSLHAVVLAGGYAKRMRPITDDFPKPLLPITNHDSALDLIVDKLSEIDVDRIFISTNLKFERHFRAWVTATGFANVDVMVEPSTSEQNKLGAIRALSDLVSQLPVDDYLILAGDNIFNGSLRGIISLYDKLRKPLVAVIAAENKEQVTRGSTVTLDRNMKVLKFEEKPTHPTSALIGVAIYLMPYQTLLRTREYLTKGGRTDEPGYFISWLCEKEDVYAYRLEGRFWDIGSTEEYERTRLEFTNSQRE
jgi:glucose-1-phosphate thymidylyltransferase